MTLTPGVSALKLLPLTLKLPQKARGFGPGSISGQAGSLFMVWRNIRCFRRSLQFWPCSQILDQSEKPAKDTPFTNGISDEVKKKGFIRFAAEKVKNLLKRNLRMTCIILGVFLTRVQPTKLRKRIFRLSFARLWSF